MDVPAPTEDAAWAMADCGYGGLVLDRLAQKASRLLAAERTCIYVRDRGDPRSTIVVAGHGVDEDSIGSRVAADEGLVGRVMATGRPRLVADHQRLWGPVENQESNGARATALVPIRSEDRVRGVFMAASTDPARRFYRQDFNLLAELADLAAASLEHGESRSRFNATVAARVDALALALEARDGYTAEHSAEVVELARRVGQRLGLEPTALIELEFGARLHDIGKLRVPDHLLRKEAPLTEAEWEIMRSHPAWGSEMLAAIPGLQVVATIVRFHHERWDGEGYPEGLCGERIPLASRIIAASDAYRAMASGRPYRRALTRDEMLAELVGGAGTQFDPTVVTAIVELAYGDEAPAAVAWHEQAATAH